MFSLIVDEEIELCLVDLLLAPQMVAIILDEKEYLGQWLAWPMHTDTIADYLEYVKIVADEYAQGKGIACNILFRGKPVGAAGFNYINKSLRKAEIGYWLSEKAQGNGIMTRACKKLINIAFTELDLEKIEVPVATGNKASRAVCERLGMHAEGTITNAENLNGRIIDHVYYALARPKT